MASTDGIIGRIISYSGAKSRLVLFVALLASLWGAYCLKNIRIDALPELSETQVILYSEWMGRSPISSRTR